MQTNPNEFIIAALDLCNIRNKVTHEDAEESWKTVQMPYAIHCLAKIIESY